MERSFKISDCVFAKLGCYPHWPARVLEIVEGSEEQYKVIFYGTHDWSVLKADDLVKYNDQSIKKYGSKNRYRGFQKGMMEIQMSLTFNNLVLVNELEQEQSKRKRNDSPRSKGRKFKRVKLSN